MPISTTAAWIVSSRVSSVLGRPTRLFRLPCVFIVSYWALSTCAIISLVVVLPALPVTATIRNWNLLR